MNKILLIKDVEEVTGKKIRKNAVSCGWDVAEEFTGIAILRTDETKIYIEDLQKITTNSKDDIKHRMDGFIDSLDKFKQGVKYKEFKINIVEDSWMGKNVFVLKNLVRFSTLIWREFRKESDYIDFLLPTSARSQIGFNKTEQLEVGNVKTEVYTRDTKSTKTGKILHKKGDKKKVDIKLLVQDYLKMAFGVDIEDNDEADGFVLALAGLLK